MRARPPMTSFFSACTALQVSQRALSPPPQQLLSRWPAVDGRPRGGTAASTAEKNDEKKQEQPRHPPSPIALRRPPPPPPPPPPGAPSKRQNTDAGGAATGGDGRRAELAGRRTPPACCCDGPARGRPVEAARPGQTPAGARRRACQLRLQWPPPDPWRTGWGGGGGSPVQSPPPVGQQIGLAHRGAAAGGRPRARRPSGGSAVAVLCRRAPPGGVPPRGGRPSPWRPRSNSSAPPVEHTPAAASRHRVQPPRPFPPLLPCVTQAAPAGDP